MAAGNIIILLMQERCVVHEIGSSVDYRKMTSV